MTLPVLLDYLNELLKRIEIENMSHVTISVSGQAMEDGEVDRQDGGKSEGEEPVADAVPQHASPPNDGDTGSSNDVIKDQLASADPACSHMEPTTTAAKGDEAAGDATSINPPVTADEGADKATVSDENDPVNLKVGEAIEPTSSQQPHHVRTITLTSEYRQQEQQQTESSAASAVSVIYSQHEEQQSDNAEYYHQNQQHFAGGEEAAERYRGEVSSTTKMELLDVATSAAQVPNGPYTIIMEGDEEEQAEQGLPTSNYGSSRLATFQVKFRAIAIIRYTGRYDNVTDLISSHRPIFGLCSRVV